jgi:hypothetical protein
MHDRLAISLAVGGNLTVNTIKEETFRSTEAALYLLVMGGGVEPKAPKKYVLPFSSLKAIRILIKMGG